MTAQQYLNLLFPDFPDLALDIYLTIPQNHLQLANQLLHPIYQQYQATCSDEELEAVYNILIMLIGRHHFYSVLIKHQ